jgi:broad specificity phosphatase PhoE
LPGPSSSPVIYLIRHGRTALNAAGLLRGHLDVPLDDVGRSEADRLGDVFAGIALAVVVASPLTRAMETAAPVILATHSTLEIDKDLIDRDYGPWSGRARSEVEVEWSSVDNAPDVEPLDAFAARVTGALERLAQGLGEVPAAVVAHEVVNQVALARLVPDLPQDPWSIRQRTGCWNQYSRPPAGGRRSSTPCPVTVEGPETKAYDPDRKIRPSE